MYRQNSHFIYIDIDELFDVLCISTKAFSMYVKEATTRVVPAIRVFFFKRVAKIM